VAFQGAVADVLAFHPRQRGEHSEHDPGRVVRALQFAGEELQSDIRGAQLLGELGELDAAAEPLVLVHDDRDGGTGRADLPGEGDGPVELGRVTARVEIFSAKTRATPEAFSESVWVSSDWRGVDARAGPIRTCAAGAVPAAGVVLRGHPAPARPARRPGRGRAG
jgi:hypothetical protein